MELKPTGKKSRRRIDDLFDSEQKVSKKSLYFSILLFIALIVMFRLHDVSYDFTLFLKIEKSDIGYLCNLILSIVASLTSAFVFSYYYEKKESNAIKYLKEICDPDLLANWLYDMERFSGRYREQERINVKLHKIPENELVLICEAEYEYFAKLISPTIQISFHRLNDKIKMNQYTGSSNELLMNEFYWANDETDFPENAVCKEYYNVTKIMVGLKEIIPSISLENQDMKIVYRAEVPEDIDLSDLVLISYVVRFPIERETALHFTHELPTKAVKIEFDYSLIGDEIIVFSIPITGATSAPRIDNPNRPHIITYRHTGWLLPKHGFVFSWWKNSRTIK